jgi:dTDP-4-dehydrorhamnose 3,5-epimerase
VEIRPLAIADAHVITPVSHADERGLFLEGFRADVLERATGRRFEPVQVNRSISRRGVVRGIHYADVPPGQAKYVMVTAGAILDYVIDIRVGSPTFGQWEAVALDDVENRAVFLAEGLGHLFVVTSESASMVYLVSDVYRPECEHTISPLDPEIGLEFPFATDELILSERDVAAPSFSEARSRGMLPEYAECVARYGKLAAR